MKDSRKFSPKVTRLFNALKRKSSKKHSMPQYSDPVDAVIYALAGEHVSIAASERMYKRIVKHFVNSNDLRVSRREEILDVFGNSFEAAEKIAGTITQVLNAVFDKKNTVSLTTLGQEGKRQAHKELSEIEGITPFAVSYCFLTSLDGHAIPLNAAMLGYLRDNQLVHPDATDAEIAGFLERQVSAADAYDFYMLLRHEAEHPEITQSLKMTSSKKKTTTKKKKVTKKKTAAKKKVTTKKKTATKKKNVKKK